MIAPAYTDQAPKLQCGHGSDAVENHPIWGTQVLVALNFNAATAVTPWRTTLPALPFADIGTVLQCGHGSDAVENQDQTPAGRDPIDRLQCGHGSDAVENPAVKQFARWLVADLQCGHGSDAVENRGSRAARGSPAKTFNAATAVTPWRTAEGVGDARDVGGGPSMRPRQ